MYRIQRVDEPVWRRRFSWYALCLSGLLCCWLLGALPVYAEGVPGGNISDPAVRGADIARPAVVRIVTTVKGRLSVHFPPTTDVTFPQQENGNYDLSFSGTGTFISAQGDILTADHVINPPRDKNLNAALYAAAADDIAKYMNQNAQSGAQQVTKDQVVQQLTGGQLQSTPTYEQGDSVAFLSTDYTGPLTAPDFQSLPTGIALKVDQIKKESAPDQQDTAIIHVPMQDTPSVALGNSTDVQPLDKLTIIGFPGNGDVSNKPNDLLTSSLNILQVSSKKNSDTGAPLIQVSGNAGHGDSGAPALNSEGQIVGIVSYKQADTDNSGSNATFLQASQSAQAMIEALNLDTTPGTFQQLWNQSFQDYAATTSGHWHRAQQGFDQLAQKYPLFKAVQPYQEYARTQAAREATSTPTPTATVRAQPTATAVSNQPHNTTTTPVSLPIAALAVAGGVLVIALVGTFFWVLVRPRRKKGAEPAPAPAVNKTPDEEKKSEGSASKPPTPSPAPKPISQPGGTTPPAAGQPQGQQTLPLKIWPCGHLNRPGARFCSVCGEAAPTSGGSATTLH